jgi:hypothetical protein
LRKFESSQLADAVTIEPVSASQFPANREKNREFYDSEQLLAGPDLTKADIMGLISAISLQTRSGNLPIDIREPWRHNREISSAFYGF